MILWLFTIGLMVLGKFFTASKFIEYLIEIKFYFFFHCQPLIVFYQTDTEFLTLPKEYLSSSHMTTRHYLYVSSIVQLFKMRAVL